MNPRFHRFFALALSGVLALAAHLEARAAGAGMVVIPAGVHEPILRGKDEPERVTVPAFRLDVRPVTNAEFLEFVRANPKWRRGQVGPLFADNGYLGDWTGELELGPKAPAEAPVVRISWFAARAFATWRGKRLPTTAEWERAAAVGFMQENGRTEPGFREGALAWFARPTPQLWPAAGAGRPNFYGVRDLLTLVWEWVDDFNTALVTGESRADTGLERTQFCGAGAPVPAIWKTIPPSCVRGCAAPSVRAMSCRTSVFAAPKIYENKNCLNSRRPGLDGFSSRVPRCEAGRLLQPGGKTRGRPEHAFPLSAGLHVDERLRRMRPPRLIARSPRRDDDVLRAM